MKKRKCVTGAHQEGPVGGPPPGSGGGGAKEAGAGGLAGEDGDLEGQDGARLLSDLGLTSEGAEGELKDFKKENF